MARKWVRRVETSEGERPADRRRSKPSGRGWPLRIPGAGGPVAPADVVVVVVPSGRWG
jgi:hypothetical protein